MDSINTATPARASPVRYLILLMLFLVTTLNYADRATLSIAGVECTYRGRLSDSYTGKLYCPDRPAVPLELWVK